MSFKVRLLFGALLAGMTVFASSARGESLEPVVTAREAERLAQASAVAATNAPQAIALLNADGLEGASAALNFAVGNFYFQMEQYEAAVTAYGEAVRKWPSFRNARKNMGRAFLILGREDEAIRVYQKLVEDGHFDVDTFLLLGHGLMLRKHAVPAESAYRQVLLLDPENRDALRGLIQALLEQQRYTEVRSLLRTALDAEPGEAAYWSLLANVEVSLGSTTDSIRVIETARRLAACTPMTLMLLGDLYLDAGRAAEAVARYDDARAAGGIESGRFLRAVEGLVILGEMERATEQLDAVEKSLQGKVDVLPVTKRTITRLRAELASMAGDVDRAVVMYRDLVAQDPLDGKALLRLGDLLQETHSTGEAEMVYERAGRLPGYEAAGLVRRARLSVDSARIAEAVELLEAAQRVEAQPSVARYLEQLRHLQKN